MTEQTTADLQMVIDRLAVGVTVECGSCVDLNGDRWESDAWQECKSCTDGQRPLTTRDIGPESDRPNGLPSDALWALWVRDGGELRTMEDGVSVAMSRRGHVRCGETPAKAIRAALVALAWERETP